MISGAMRGRGGRALSHHLLKPENDTVTVIPARGLGSEDLHGQLDELVALSLGGGTDRPCYHVHVDPDLTLALEDNVAARERWWSLFEKEFKLEGQPYLGVEHVKHGRPPHEHRVYSLVYPTGRVVNLRHDFARREKLSRRVEHEFGLAPVHSKHARSIEATLRSEGHDDAAAWIAAAGHLEVARPVAPLSPAERSQQERTDVRKSDVEVAALAAWHASEDGDGFQRELAARGLRLHSGRAGPIVVDRSGAAHSLTRAVGVASKRIDGTRIPAAAVRARLADVDLEQPDGETGGSGTFDPTGPNGTDFGGTGGGSGAGSGGGVDDGLRRPCSGGDRPGGGGRRSEPSYHERLDRLRALPAGRRALLTRRARAGVGAALARGRHDFDKAMSRIDRDRDRQGNGLAVTDMWGIGRV